jgi:biopolymer transport protein ExbD
MGKFKKDGKREVGQISTASLPDIVFMLLFFFMVVTVIREVELKVSIVEPGATEVKKLEKKSLVSYIYIGEPQTRYRAIFGTEPRIQLNDVFANVSDIRAFISSERDALNESDRGFMTVSLKVDRDTKMGVVVDVKQALRKASALRINYAARQVESVY